MVRVNLIGLMENKKAPTCISFSFENERQSKKRQGWLQRTRHREHPGAVVGKKDGT